MRKTSHRNLGRAIRACFLLGAFLFLLGVKMAHVHAHDMEHDLYTPEQTAADGTHDCTICALSFLTYLPAETFVLQYNTVARPVHYTPYTEAIHRFTSTTTFLRGPPARF